MKAMEDEYGTVFVASAGNQPIEVATYPAVANEHMEGMLVVGATDFTGQQWSSSAHGFNVFAWAPGVDVPGAPASGTSICMSTAQRLKLCMPMARC